MTDKAPTPAGEDMFPSIAGDVRSNGDTIRALREGVAVQSRLAVAVMQDAFGDTHKIPLGVKTSVEGGIEIDVLADVLVEVERRAGGPRHRSGTTELYDLGSLIAYVQRFKHSDVAVGFATGGLAPSITVILDFDQRSGESKEMGVTGWRSDRAVYRCPLSRQWKDWTSKDGAGMSQAAFGDWIEQRADDIGTADGFADATTMLSVARSLAIYDKGTVKREVNPTTGEGTLMVSTEHDVKSTKIPRAFQLAIPIFEGAPELYPVEARVRFALDRNTGAAAFAYTLHNRAQAYEHALGELRGQLSSATGIPVYIGTAPLSAR